MRAIDDYTPQQIEMLQLKGMLTQNYKGLIQASEKVSALEKVTNDEIRTDHTFDIENDTNTIASTPESEPWDEAREHDRDLEHESRQDYATWETDNEGELANEGESAIN